MRGLKCTRLTFAMVIAIVGIPAICIQPQLSNVLIEINTLQHPLFFFSFPLSFPSPVFFLRCLALVVEWSAGTPWRWVDQRMVHNRGGLAAGGRVDGWSAQMNEVVIKANMDESGTLHTTTYSTGKRLLLRTKNKCT